VLLYKDDVKLFKHFQWMFKTLSTALRETFVVIGLRIVL